MKMFATAALMSLALAAPVFAQTSAPAGPPASVTTEAKPGSEDVVISGEVKRATPPDGDPRSVGERRENKARYDRCIVNAKEPEMYNPVDSTPEEYCSKRLGMDDHDAIPNSVRTSN